MHPKSPAQPATRARRLRIPLALSGLLVTATVVAQGADDPESLLRRYPFDPACPWGRISNGKGMIVRCLSEDESAAVLRKVAVPAAAPVATAAPSSASAAERFSLRRRAPDLGLA